MTFKLSKINLIALLRTLKSPSLGFILLITFVTATPIFSEPIFAQNNNNSGNKKSKPADGFEKKKFEEDPFVDKKIVISIETILILSYLGMYYSRISQNIRKGRKRLKRIDQRTIFTYVLFSLLMIITGIYHLLTDLAMSEYWVAAKMILLMVGIALTIISLENRNRIMSFYSPIPLLIYLVLMFAI